MLKLSILVILTGTAIHRSGAFSIGTNKIATVQVQPKVKGFDVTVQGHDTDYKLDLRKPGKSLKSNKFS